MMRALTEGSFRDFGGTYFQIEKEIYEQLLTNPDEEVKGTVKELAEKYGQESAYNSRLFKMVSTRV